MVHPGSVWVEVESATVEVDGGLEVLPVPIPADSPLDGHDLTVDTLGDGVRDSMSAVTDDIRKPLFDGVRDGDQRREIRFDDPLIPMVEETNRSALVWDVPKIAELFVAFRQACDF